VPTEALRAEQHRGFTVPAAHESRPFSTLYAQARCSVYFRWLPLASPSDDFFKRSLTILKLFHGSLVILRFESGDPSLTQKRGSHGLRPVRPARPARWKSVGLSQFLIDCDTWAPRLLPGTVVASGRRGAVPCDRKNLSAPMRNALGTVNARNGVHLLLVPTTRETACSMPARPANEFAGYQEQQVRLRGFPRPASSTASVVERSGAHTGGLGAFVAAVSTAGLLHLHFARAATIHFDDRALSAAAVRSNSSTSRRYEARLRRSFRLADFGSISSPWTNRCRMLPTNVW